MKYVEYVSQSHKIKKQSPLSALVTEHQTTNLRVMSWNLPGRTRLRYISCEPLGIHTATAPSCHPLPDRRVTPPDAASRDNPGGAQFVLAAGHWLSCLLLEQAVVGNPRLKRARRRDARPHQHVQTFSEIVTDPCQDVRRLGIAAQRSVDPFANPVANLMLIPEIGAGQHAPCTMTRPLRPWPARAPRRGTIPSGSEIPRPGNRTAEPR